MADMQRPGRVCRDEFQQNLRPVPGWLPTIVCALAQSGFQLDMKSCWAEVKVNEPGPCDLDFVDLMTIAQCGDNARGELSRVFSCGLGKSHGDIARKVTVTGISRTLDRTFDRKIACSLGELR